MRMRQLPSTVADAIIRLLQLSPLAPGIPVSAESSWPRGWMRAFAGYDTEAQFARSSLLRKRSTVASATSLAMKLCPMPRARMKVSLPRSTFLS